jgi:lysine-specific histone demethylase 1B
MVAEIESLGNQVKTSCEVESILDGSPDKVAAHPHGFVKIHTKQGDEFIARTALITIPLAVLKKNAAKLFNPALPARRLDTIERVTVGNLNKVLLHYERPWWNQDAGTFLVLPSKDTKAGQAEDEELWKLYSTNTLIVGSLLQPSSGAGSDNGSSTSLLVMMGGRAAEQLESFERVQAGNTLHKYLAFRLGNAEDAQLPRHVFYSRWNQHELTGGATTSPVSLEHGSNSPLDFTALGRPLWNGRLGFAGEHTDQDRKYFCQPAHMRACSS